MQEAFSCTHTCLNVPRHLDQVQSVSSDSQSVKLYYKHGNSSYLLSIVIVLPFKYSEITNCFNCSLRVAIYYFWLIEKTCMYRNKTNYIRHRRFSGTLFCFKQFNLGSYGNTNLNISVGLLKSDSSWVVGQALKKLWSLGFCLFLNGTSRPPDFLVSWSTLNKSACIDLHFLTVCSSAIQQCAIISKKLNKIHNKLSFSEFYIYFQCNIIQIKARLYSQKCSHTVWITDHRHRKYSSPD